MVTEYPMTGLLGSHGPVPRAQAPSARSQVRADAEVEPR